MTAPLYTREILRLAAAIPHLVRFEDLEGAVEGRSPTCGSRMRVAVELDAKGRIAGLRQAVEACAFGQAAAALMGGNASGLGKDQVRSAVRGIEAWLGGSDDPQGSWPGLEVLASARSRTGRHGAILLPFRTLLAAVEAAQ